VIDPRVLLVLSLLSGSIVFSLHTQTAMLGLSIVLYGLHLRVPVHDRAHRIFLMILVGQAVYICLSQWGWERSAQFITYLFIMIPLSQMALILYQNVSIRDILYLLDSLRTPRSVTVTLSVTYRFLPTILEEMKRMFDALRLRGLPTRRLMLLFVPIVIRCIKLADELTVSALTRGIESPNARTVWNPPVLRGADWWTLCVWLVLLLLIYCVDNYGMAAFESWWVL
jgi:energy-coupling factor transporter transmembrane protein EcfT